MKRDINVSSPINVPLPLRDDQSRDENMSEVSFMNANGDWQQRHLELMRDNKLFRIYIIGLKSTIEQLTKENEKLVMESQMAHHQTAQNQPHISKSSD
jgi:hypothetical protein